MEVTLLILAVLAALFYLGHRDEKSIDTVGQLENHEVKGFDMPESTAKLIAEAPAKKAREFNFTRGSLAELRHNNRSL